LQKSKFIPNFAPKNLQPVFYGQAYYRTFYKKTKYKIINMATKTYSQKITNAKVLIDGLKKIKSNLPAGITDDTILNLETLREKIETLNSENEGLKAESKKKTEDINSKLKELDKLYSQMKKRVKLDIEPSLWGKFGIEDKR